ncbi:23S rRNA (adenine(2503)-C(2))-methyltransferase RlmN [Xylanibacillus composti]|uniref:Probable dual-specificity RNA methyltransferase RlmN n=1 Tax=Xylanibacillus composti TaxID=1572762 RepID=A0A8J4H4H6_9BACL|nr:23S rRNA (adenine(2503)-C(2))-methyltransferase RlmN [Xylanibacillus composti]MDT9726113.1 23S rRNA (adenine(2503)-C(2))-methyltransferase RlmN [Xylanibacillus composti]GIQ68739.1 putative dual-specificity RNA methyltransferase RlmN [Xylanibacillus composti]
MSKPSIYGYTFDQLAAWLEDRGYSKYWASRVWQQLYRERAADFAAMADVPETCTALLADQLLIGSMDVHVQQESRDGTVKFLFRLADGHLIETVLMRHKFGLTVCVTTQVGCNIGCSFCASGLLAKKRDLASGEIVEQIMQVQRYLDEAGRGERVTHTVVMGIGEPFDNFDHLIAFLRIVMDPKGLAIGPRHITVSTSGLAEKIRAFADLNLRVNLALSLHAPNNELRTRIMKINRAIPIEELMEAIDDFIARTNQRVTIEYILLKDVNDGVEQALELAELLRGREGSVHVNLIPYNPVDEHSQYQRSEESTVRAFFDTMKKRGFSCSVRLEHGTDIDAACGQLRSKQLREEGEPSLAQ